MALGMKQNMVGGLVFAAVILVGSRLTHRLSTGDLLRLGAMVAGGALVPVLATVLWAVSAGVRLESVWYSIYGFRSQALAVILESNIDAPAIRAMLLLGTVIATGMAFVVAGAVAHVRRLWHVNGPLTVAALVVVAVDTSGLVLSGSYWQAYLFILIPGVVLCTTLLLAIRVHVARRVWLLTILAMVSALVSSVVRTGLYVADIRTPTAVRSGEAIAAASEPGDTIVVYGGRAELVLASGLESPYEHLWSLPMRTRDPDLDELKGVSGGSRRPHLAGVLGSTLGVERTGRVPDADCRPAVRVPRAGLRRPPGLSPRGRVPSSHRAHLRRLTSLLSAPPSEITTRNGASAKPS